MGILMGVLAFGSGMSACFSGLAETPRQSFFLLIALLAMLSVLPLSVAAVARPHFAGRGIAVAWLSYNIAVFGSMGWARIVAAPRGGLAELVLFTTALPLTVVWLLLRAPTSEASKRPVAAESAAAADRKRLAKWIGLALGLGLGAWQFRFAWRFLHGPLGGNSWMVAGSALPWLAAVPAAILGFWKPRLAGYVFIGCFLVSASALLPGARTFGDALGFLLFDGALALPFLFVAALLFYASPGSAGPAPAGDHREGR